jgi:FkbM family methyltransferase
MIYHYSKILLSSVLNLFGLGLIRNHDLLVLKRRAADAELSDFDFKLIPLLKASEFEKFLQIRKYSKAQLRQDYLALMFAEYKNGGYFVEVGAADGIFASNTHLLEFRYGWRGILAEPSKSWHKDLESNRKANLSYKAIFNESGHEKTFFEAEANNLSTMSEFRNFDGGGLHRKKFKEYLVQTQSLSDLLIEFSAPLFIDYLSIDTEGSEYLIIRDFPFEKYDIKFISIEHNYNENRQRIQDLLISKGYSRYLPEISEYDDWFIKLR